MATIKVRGHGSVEVRADEAVLTFEAVAVAAAAADAFAAASERAALLDEVLDDAGIEPARRSTLGVVLQEHHELDGAGQPRRTHRASTTVNVRMTEPDAIPAVLAAVVERSGAYVRGPHWRAADTTEAASEACRRAVADARGRAESYAGALGVRLGRVASVDEVAAGDFGPVHPPVRAMAAAVPAAVHPAELAVSAIVDIVFELADD
jgi:uncharacterized protein YggE